MPATGSSPTAGRRELGVLLRALRTERGWTVDQVAERLLCSPSKVSRLETGQRGASPRDIRDLSDLYEVDPQMRRRLGDLADQGKQSAWWQSRGLPYSTYVGLEAAAERISDFGLGLVPGLLQTEDYARTVLRVFRPLLSEEEIEQRLAGRIERQRILTSERPPEFEALIDEGVLYRVAGDPSIMRRQLQSLLESSELSNVSVSVLPFSVGLLPSNNNKFIILKFAEPALPTVIFIEGLTTDQFLENSDDVAAYTGAFHAMRQMAASATRTRAMITSAMSALGD